MNTFNLYAKYYDLLYQDKNYEAEATYIDQIIRSYASHDPKDILNLGCGTGKHDYHLSNKGYNVHGVDLSKEMILAAKANYGDHMGIQFFEGDITKWEHPNKKRFDVVVSLFHVISYQTENLDVVQTFKTAGKHLRANGIFIFDCWYGPGVFSEKPETRVKRFENQDLKILRISEPDQHYNDNVVNVNFDVLVTDKRTDQVQSFRESHKMRYFFIPELKQIASLADFTPLAFLEWMSRSNPSKSTWNLLGVLRKTS